MSGQVRIPKAEYESTYLRESSLGAEGKGWPDWPGRFWARVIIQLLKEDNSEGIRNGGKKG